MKMQKVFGLVAAVVMLVGVMFSTGCATQGYQQNQSAFNQGAIGALLGGVAGGVIGNNSHGAFGNREGMVAGAALGGLLGGTMGHQKDQFGRQMSAQGQQIQAANEAANTLIVNVVNSNGSVTPVVIRRVGNQYMGPRGEYYNYIPSPDQLKTYGF